MSQGGRSVSTLLTVITPYQGGSENLREREIFLKRKLFSLIESNGKEESIQARLQRLEGYLRVMEPQDRVLTAVGARSSAAEMAPEEMQRPRKRKRTSEPAMELRKAFRPETSAAAPPGAAWRDSMDEVVQTVSTAGSKRPWC